MKFFGKLSGRDLSVIVFAISLFQFLSIPFEEPGERWGHFFAGAVMLFIALLILGITNPEK